MKMPLIKLLLKSKVHLPEDFGRLEEFIVTEPQSERLDMIFMPTMTGFIIYYLLMRNLILLSHKSEIINQVLWP